MISSVQSIWGVQRRTACKVYFSGSLNLWSLWLPSPIIWMIARWSSVLEGWIWMPSRFVTQWSIWICLFWIHSFKLQWAAFWILTVIDWVLAKIEVVGWACSSASIGQIMLLKEIVSIAAVGNRGSSGFRNFSAVLDYPKRCFLSYFFLLSWAFELTYWTQSGWFLFPFPLLFVFPYPVLVTSAWSFNSSWTWPQFLWSSWSVVMISCARYFAIKLQFQLNLTPVSMVILISRDFGPLEFLKFGFLGIGWQAKILLRFIW